MKYVMSCELCGEELASAELQESNLAKADLVEQIKSSEQIVICPNCGSTDFTVDS